MPRRSRAATRLALAALALAAAATAHLAPGAPVRADEPSPSRQGWHRVEADDPWHPVTPIVPNPADKRPNVVLVLADDMRTADLRYLPHINRLLVDRGTYYADAISPHPICCPARAELVTGQFGQNSGVRHNGGRFGGYHALRDKDDTIGSWLTDAGYLTYYEGKYLNGYRRSGRTPESDDWTRWSAQIRGIYEYGRVAVRYSNRDLVPKGTYITDIVAGRTASTLDRFAQPGSPFFAFVNHVAPHTTLRRWPGTGQDPIAERRYRDAFSRLRLDTLRKRSYNEVARGIARFGQPAEAKSTRTLTQFFRHRLRALLSVDDAVGRLVDDLRRRGELANTYIVFASDNGMHIGEHGIRGKNTLYDESLRVPIVVRGPGIAAGRVSRTPVTLVDLVAQILQWTGVPAGRELDGLPFGQVASRRDTVLIQTGDNRADGSPGWAYRGVLTDRYTYAHVAGSPGRGLLFDNRRDPAQLDNLFRDRRYAAVRRELAHRTRVLQDCDGQADCNRRFGRLPKPRR